MVRSNSLTSSIVMSALEKDHVRPMRGKIGKVGRKDRLFFSIISKKKIAVIVIFNYNQRQTHKTHITVKDLKDKNK